MREFPTYFDLAQLWRSHSKLWLMLTVLFVLQVILAVSILLLNHRIDVLERSRPSPTTGAVR
jgi:hypothetical protein